MGWVGKGLGAFGGIWALGFGFGWADTSSPLLPLLLVPAGHAAGA